MTSINYWQIRLALMTLAGITVITLASCSNPAVNRSIASNSEVNLNKQITTAEGQTKLEVPGSIAAEHRELHEEHHDQRIDVGEEHHAPKRGQRGSHHLHDKCGNDLRETFEASAVYERRRGRDDR